VDTICGRLHGRERSLAADGAARNSNGHPYAVWTGIGAIGAFFVGIAAFGDASTAMRFLSVGLITAGIIGLKLA
jgi:hypothetical protein